MTSTITAPYPPAPRPRVVSPLPRLRRVRYEPDPGTPHHDGDVREAPPPRRPEPERPADDPDPDAVGRALGATLRLAMEVLDGRRPPAQLAAHFEGVPLRYWRAATHQRRVRSPARVKRVLVSLPHPDAAELTAVCDVDGRIRALAARFDRAGPGGRWTCTALRLG